MKRWAVVLAEEVKGEELAVGCRQDGAGWSDSGSLGTGKRAQWRMARLQQGREGAVVAVGGDCEQVR